MNSSAFEKVLLSAILTSCTVFSVLMVAFIPRRPEPIAIDPLDHIESAEAVNQRDVVIRHIGMSIVVSVGAGITTAELIRKQGRSREIAEGRRGFSAQAMLQAVAPNLTPDLALPGDGFTASLNGIIDSSASYEPQAFHQRTVTELAADRADRLEQAELPLFLFQPSTVPLQSENVNWFQPFEPDAASLDPSPQPPLDAVGWQSTSQLVLSSHDQYHTCRISLPGVSERVLAILFDGQYYRFVKLTRDREQALRLAARRDQQGEVAVITADRDRYAVWSLEPEACLEVAMGEAML